LAAIQFNQGGIPAAKSRTDDHEGEDNGMHLQKEQDGRSFVPPPVLYYCLPSTDALRHKQVERCVTHYEHGLGNDSTKKEEVATMFNRVMAIELLVQDLARCTAFYRDTLGLQVRESESTPDSVSFQMGNVYFFLLEVSGAARMISEEALELRIEGGPRVLLAAGVEDVDAAYEALKARGVTVFRPPTDQPWGLRTAYFADPEGNLWEINQPIEAKPEG
jgi:lactoylglutathione lyase